jgi:hypothetical protein
MLQVFYLDVAKVDLDVGYICKCSRCFHTYVCKRFHLYVVSFTMATHMLSSFFWCFISVSDVCCKFFSYFGHILQVFHMSVAKVDCMLHMLNETQLP